MNGYKELELWKRYGVFLPSLLGLFKLILNNQPSAKSFCLASEHLVLQIAYLLYLPVGVEIAIIFNIVLLSKVIFFGLLLVGRNPINIVETAHLLLREKLFPELPDLRM
jgi:hypothetical protein